MPLCTTIKEKYLDDTPGLKQVYYLYFMSSLAGFWFSNELVVRWPLVPQDCLSSLDLADRRLFRLLSASLLKTNTSTQKPSENSFPTCLQSWK